MAQNSLAVLIDADNAQPANVEGIFSEVARHGVAIVRRIYGDWTSPTLNGWKKNLLDYSIQPIQQFRYTVGKNATDSALIIDAMDLLYTGRLDGYCIVSSDSDFTRLASRLRESGAMVIGMGEKNTPVPFVNACDKFVYVEVFAVGEKTAHAGRKSASELRADEKLIKMIRKAIRDSSDESGWAIQAAVGNNIVKQSPEFDPRNYGYQKLGELLRAIGLFDIERREIDENPGHFRYYVRDRRRNEDWNE